MKEKILFEIPVYSMSEEVFSKRWDKHKKNFYNDFLKNNSEDNTRRIYEKLFFPRFLWCYNQIVGYIVIATSGLDIELKLFMGVEKKTRYDTVKKNFMKDDGMLGSHRYTEFMNDNEIKEELDDMILDIKEMLSSRFYVDETVYKNIIQYINLKNIICDNSID